MLGFRVASHQPPFLPWPGFWHKALSVDRFVLSCEVKWVTDGFLNRVKHNSTWLTLPVNVNDSDPISKARIANDTRLLHKVVKTVASVRGPYYERLGTIVDTLQSLRPGDQLWQVNAYLIEDICTIIGAESPVFVPDFGVHSGSTVTEKLVKKVQSKVSPIDGYYAGFGANEYIQLEQCPFPVYMQRLSPDAGKRSILQVIAQEDDPLQYLSGLGTWEQLK